ncbi:potassium-transporting ATPase ATP-binding subunit [Glutamicibacter uratoxydans]|uniref:Potassium-transporting ATPase ATP-binding subunit n=1 Tax=Glutamicibacter uratoxydans TaxID=43667 RepID=A0A4Y4DKU3_GLUUR|nr:potassium-transporting ATPase subunit KdpB [Glutamicibacter uratoxydans]GED05929.1 potassium-transporting ATPase ATP-binding subunit [Glutamicibacter uratoxydans]
MNLRSAASVCLDALVKFDPRYLWHNPVLLLTEAGAVLCTFIAVSEALVHGPSTSGGTTLPAGFTWLLCFGLWATLFVATLAESIAEGHGRRQSSHLHTADEDVPATLVLDYDQLKDAAARTARTEQTTAGELKPGDVVLVEAGMQIPADGEVIWGRASVDESELTGGVGEAIRQAGTDRTAVTGGTTVSSDRLVVKIQVGRQDSVLSQTLKLARGAQRQKSPIEMALNTLLASFCLAFMLLALSLNLAVSEVAAPISIPVLIAVVVCLIPTEIAALMSVTGIASMYKLLQRGVLVASAKALETAGGITTVILDKTGTITRGNRTAVEFIVLGGTAPDTLLSAAALASAQDPTPEGRSIIELANQLADGTPSEGQIRQWDQEGGTPVAFSASTRMSGHDLADGTKIRKGSQSAILAWLKAQGTAPRREIVAQMRAEALGIARNGGTPLVVAVKEPGAPGRALGLVDLRDVIKEGVSERITRFRELGVRTLMVTGDDRVAAATIAAAAQIDEVVGDATPQDKLALIGQEQAAGHFVAMSGDGINDAPALAQADIGVAMNSAAAAAKQAANMVILDDNPTHLVDIVEIGRRQMATRGALITFNFANDVIRYFTLFPALFVGAFPGLAVLNILQLHSPASAIISTVMFSVVVMGILLPLAIWGVPYKAANLQSALSRNLLYCGVPGLLVPAIGIKIIDLFISMIPGF